MQRLKPFVTDGCSGGMSKFWRLVFKRPPPWEGCCELHDIPYHTGGSRAYRLESDIMLMFCVMNKRKGCSYWMSYFYILLGLLMFIAVRIGGHPLLPLPWRWGYGYSYPKYYTEDRR
ncbi:MAG: hypothetical protein KAJ73_00580 [Zetaproteobacteria bacterium]|nr:hypothetical protein [Zetaproteobacteria bacterium]